MLRGFAFPEKRTNAIDDALLPWAAPRETGDAGHDLQRLAQVILGARVPAHPRADGGLRHVDDLAETLLTVDTAVFHEPCAQQSRAESRTPHGPLLYV